jgi:hypothetical protein
MKEPNHKSGVRKSAAAAPEKARVQGEGDYEAARRYRHEVEEYLQTADIEGAARAAAPHDEQEAKEMAAAEAAGRARAKSRRPRPKQPSRKP